MATFKDWSIGTKLGVGFGSVLVLLGAVSGAAYKGIDTSSDGFSEYRRIARGSLAVAQLDSGMLNVRVNRLNYLKQPSAERQQRVLDSLGKVQSEAAEIKAAISNPERAALAAQITERLQGYASAFTQQVALVEKRHALTDEVGVIGAGVVNGLDGLTTVLRNTNQTDALFLAAGFRAQVLKERLAVAKYIYSSGEFGSFDDVAQQFAATDQEQAKVQAALRNQTADTNSRLAAIIGERARYTSAVRELQQTIEQSLQVENEVLTPTGAVITKASADIVTSYRADQDRLGPQVQQANATTLQVTLGVSILALFVGGFLAWSLSRLISRPLREAIVVAERIAQGDLSADVHVTSRDEVGQLLGAMQTMNSELRRIVSQVQSASSLVSSAANEVAQGSSDLAQRTEEQASALEETASSIEELNATVQQNADNSVQASRLAEQARSQVEVGAQTVQKTIGAVRSIHESSEQIADIISMIDEIAFQTNLLALNAAVEAARAGEHGRGFAVVAGEVRKLAQNSSDAANQIKELIETSVDRAEEGLRLANDSGIALQDILLSAKKVNDLVGEIANASREQASGLSQVSTAVMQMDQVTQQNAALVEQTSAASQQLGEQAGQMRKLMEFFSMEQQHSATSGSFLAHAAQIRSTTAATQAQRMGARPTRPTRTARSAARPVQDEVALSNLRPAAASNSNQDWEEF